MTVQQRVQRGIEWLDESEPGWRNRVNKYSLSVGSCRDCILGQVFDGYLEHHTGFDYAISTLLDHSYEEAMSRGFDIAPEDDSFMDLQLEWERVL